jgi:putative oxidoreductase
MKFMNALQPLGLLLLRMALAVIFIYHGYPKLARPNAGMSEFFTQHGLPGYLVAVAGILECFGGLALAAGFFARAAALLLAGEMAVAIWKVHSAHGVMAVRDYEFPLAMCAACFALATVGAGVVSLDHLIFGNGGKKRRSNKSAKE